GRAAARVAEVGKGSGATPSEVRRVVGQVGRSGRALGDRVCNPGRDADVSAVTAIERIADVRAVALGLEAVTGVRFAARAGLRHGHLRRRLERVGDGAAGAIAEVGESARTARARGAGVVVEVGRPSRGFGDRIGLAGGRVDVDAPAAGERRADALAIELDLEAIAGVRRAVRAQL